MPKKTTRQTEPSADETAFDGMAEAVRRIAAAYRIAPAERPVYSLASDPAFKLQRSERCRCRSAGATSIIFHLAL